MKTRDVIFTALIPLALVCTPTVWAETEKSSGLTLTVKAELIPMTCELNIYNHSIVLPSVQKSELESATPGTTVPSRTQTLTAFLNNCQRGQYSLRVTGTPVSGFPGALVNEATDGKASGVAHYLKYIDPSNTFYPNGTLLGDGIASEITSTESEGFKFYLEGGYMRIDDQVTNGSTRSVITIELIRN